MVGGFKMIYAYPFEYLFPVPIIALETIGSNCFYYSMSLNGQGFNTIYQMLPPGVEVIQDEETGLKLAGFNRFTSKASGSLGASQPAARVVSMALERKGGVKCASVPDALSMQALVSFAGIFCRCFSWKRLIITGPQDSQKMLVELACSTTLAPAYKPALFEKLVPVKQGSSVGSKRTVVFVVCGGFKISLDDVAEYRKELDQDLQGNGGHGKFCATTESHFR